MRGQPDRKIEKHHRQDAADSSNEKEDERQREDLSAEQRVTPAGKRDEPLESVVLELAIERSHRREDRRERKRQPEQRGGDVGVARDLGSDHEALEKHEHRDEGHRRDDTVGLPSFGAELATGDERDPIDHAAVSIAPSSIAIRDAARSSSS